MSEGQGPEHSCPTPSQDWCRARLADSASNPVTARVARAEFLSALRTPGALLSALRACHTAGGRKTVSPEDTSATERIMFLAARGRSRIQEFMTEEKQSSEHQPAEPQNVEFAEMLTQGVAELFGVSPEMLRAWRTSIEDTAPDCLRELLDESRATEGLNK